MRRQGKHKSHAGVEESMLRKEGRHSKHTNKARYLVAFFCVASLLVFLFRPTPDSQTGTAKVFDTLSPTTTSASQAGGVSSQSGEEAHVPSADIVQECLFNLKHYHEVLTDWFSGDPNMSEDDLWEQLKFSDDMVLDQANGERLDVRGIKSVLGPAKASAPGWATMPTEITAEVDANKQVTIKFKEIQKNSGQTIIILDSVAMCRSKAPSSKHVDFDIEFYSLKEKIHKQGAALMEHNE